MLSLATLLSRWPPFCDNTLLLVAGCSGKGSMVSKMIGPFLQCDEVCTISMIKPKKKVWFICAHRAGWASPRPPCLARPSASPCLAPFSPRTRLNCNTCHVFYYIVKLPRNVTATGDRNFAAAEGQQTDLIHQPQNHTSATIFVATNKLNEDVSYHK